MPTKADIRDYTQRAESALRSRGQFIMPNDEPGLAFTVYEELQRRYPNAHVTMDKPTFGGEAIFRSEDNLGTGENSQ